MEHQPPETVESAIERTVREIAAVAEIPVTPDGLKGGIKILTEYIVKVRELDRNGNR